MIAVIMPALHSMSTVTAKVDALYLKPSARDGRIGYNMIKVADDYFTSQGVDEVHHAVPVKRNFGRLLERLGYQQLELIYSKRGN